VRPNLVTLGLDPDKPWPWNVTTRAGRDPMTGQSRTKLIAGDPLRGVLVFWDRSGRLPPRPGGYWGQPTYQVKDPFGATVPLVRHDPGNMSRDTAEYDATHHGEVRLPAGLAPGEYELLAGPVTYTFTVVAPPARRGFSPVWPTTTLADVQTLLDNGYDLDLAGGVYEWVRSVYGPDEFPLRLPPGTTVRGPGAVIRCRPDTAPDPGDEWVWSAFVANEWCVLDGLTFQMLPGMRVVQANVGGSNLTLTGCHLNPAALNEPGPGLMVQDCEVSGVGAGLWTVSGGLFRRIYAHRNAQSHVLSVWAADGTLAVIDVRFDWTDRGFVAQPNWGDVRANLFLGEWCSNICWAENGSECFLAEVSSAWGFHDNLILHYRYEGGAGGAAAVQWDDKARNNYVRDVKAYGGTGFMLTGSGVVKNVFEDIELRGGYILLGPGGGNQFTNCAFVLDHGSGHGAQGMDPAWYNDWTQAVRWYDQVGPQNTFRRCVFELGPRFVPVMDVALVQLTDCWWNGTPYPGEAAAPVENAEPV
jgi:hypothetical protein